MNEKLKDIQTKAKDFWNKYDKKQKRLMFEKASVFFLTFL